MFLLIIYLIFGYIFARPIIMFLFKKTNLRAMYNLIFLMFMLVMGHAGNGVVNDALKRYKTFVNYQKMHMLGLAKKTLKKTEMAEDLKNFNNSYQFRDHIIQHYRGLLHLQNLIIMGAILFVVNLIRFYMCRLLIFRPA